MRRQWDPGVDGDPEEECPEHETEGDEDDETEVDETPGGGAAEDVPDSEEEEAERPRATAAGRSNSEGLDSYGGSEFDPQEYSDHEEDAEAGSGPGERL